MDEVTRICSVHGGDPLPLSEFGKTTGGILRRQCRKCYNKLRNASLQQRKGDEKRKVYRKIKVPAPAVAPLKLKSMVHYYVVPGIHRPQTIGIMEDFARLIPLEQKIRAVKFAVTYVTGITDSAMTRKDRHIAVVIARNLCMWYLKYNTPLKLNAIDYEIRGKTDHSQVVAAIKFIRNILTLPGDNPDNVYVKDAMAQIETLLHEYVTKGDEWLFNLPVPVRMRVERQRNPSILLKHIPNEQPKINRAKW